MSTRQTETSMSALHNAARSNNINEVQHLLTTDGVDVNARDSHGNTALHLTKDKSIASLLINVCADPNLQNADGDTPLQTWHTLNLVTGDTGRPFTGLLLNNDRKYLLDIITLLLEAGASPNIQNKHGYNSLHSLFVYGGIAGLDLEALLMHDFISLLVRFGVDVNAPDFERCTPLHHAAKEPHVLNAETLIRSGALVDAQDYRGLTPLQHVFNSDNKEMMQLLMQNKASVNAQDLDGRTALSTAVEVGNEVMVELLLEHPCTCVDLADKNCVTPLHLAAAFKRVDMTESLIQASADANACDVMNATPLHYAAYGGTPEIITLLLEAGADNKLTDNSGRLPVQYALSRHYCHTALKFGERYLRDVAESARCHVKVTGNTTDDVIVQSLPADDIFTMVVPASKVYSDALDPSIVPRDLMEYMRDKSAGNVSVYLQDMYTVSGVGKIPADMGEVENMKRSIEEFMSKWAEKIAEIDERFKGALLHSGSVYEGTKVGDPDEFDYMLCLESLAQACSITFDEDTEYSKVTVHKSVNESGSYEEFFDGHQLDSGKVMSTFVDVAKRALTLLDYTSVAREMYVESLTEHTLIEDTWTLSGTVTCNLKFKWTGLCYKQLVITVDLVPAIPVHHWPRIARQVSSVLTEDITSRGCHLVAKAGYWRLSFSLAERLIMNSLSRQQKSAFIGAKVVLHPAVSCKIIVYDDEHISDDEESANRSCGLEDHSDGQAAGTSHREGEMDVSDADRKKTMRENEKGSGSLTNEVDAATAGAAGAGGGGAAAAAAAGAAGAGAGAVAAANNDESRSVNEASHSLLATMEGRVVLSQSGDVATILKLSDAQVSGEMLLQWVEIHDDRATIDSPEELEQKLCEHESTSEDDSDVPVKTLLPFKILSTYLLKNLFFNCIEENAKDTSGSTVTTSQIFGKLSSSLKESSPVTYFFIPNQNFVGLKALEYDDRCDLVLVTTVINSLLNDALPVN